MEEKWKIFSHKRSGQKGILSLVILNIFLFLIGVKVLGHDIDQFRGCLLNRIDLNRIDIGKRRDAQPSSSVARMI